MVYHTLNPSTDCPYTLSADQIQVLTAKAQKEYSRIRLVLSAQLFALHGESQRRQLVQNFRSALFILLGTMYKYQKKLDFSNGGLAKLSNIAKNSIIELLLYTELQYPNYLSLDESLPFHYIAISHPTLKQKQRKIAKILKTVATNQPCCAIVLEVLSNLNRIDHISRGELLYCLALLDQLENTKLSESPSGMFSDLQKVLVYLNFNSIEFLNLLIGDINEKIDRMRKSSQKVESLYFCFKEFNQLPFQQRFSLNPTEQSVREAVFSWFEQEILFAEKLSFMEENKQNSNKVSKKAAVALHKIKVNLSADQIALILRAFDSSRVLESRSLSVVFRTIVPYLSTPHKKDLSFDSVRTKSYEAESRDKEISIAALERIIKHIRDF